MPVYQYECPDCGEFDRFMRMSDSGLRVRCVCGRISARRFGTPTLQTNDTFMAGRQLEGGQFKYEGERNHALGEARQAGVSVTGKAYISQLARFPGDPEAWIGSKGEAKALAVRRGAGCPELGTKRADPGPVRRPALADDIRDELVERSLAAVPKKYRTAKMIAETREAVVARHGKAKDEEPAKRVSHGRKKNKVA